MIEALAAGPRKKTIAPMTPMRYAEGATANSGVTVAATHPNAVISVRGRKRATSRGAASAPTNPPVLVIENSRPVAAALRQQDADQPDRLKDEGHTGKPQHRATHELLPPQPPQTRAYESAVPLRRMVSRVLQGAPDQAQSHGGHEVRHGIHQERHHPADAEERTTERRPDQRRDVCAGFVSRDSLRHLVCCHDMS